MSNRSRHRISIFIAILLHLVIFFIHFDSCVPYVSQSYMIEISTAPVISHSYSSTSYIKEAKVIEKVHNKLVKNIIEYPLDEVSPMAKNLENIQTEEYNASSSENSAIDARSLYEAEANQHKQTAAKLDMTGWKWDSVPKPNDTTEETGKVVFQIIIDSDGFVVGIKEIEKTISPQLVSIYKEALAKLSFSKISDSAVEGVNTKGTVTFIINAT